MGSKQDKLKKAMTAFVKPFSSEDIGKQFSKKDLIEDINFMVKTMEEVHPDLYFYFGKEKANSLLEEMKSSLPDECDRIDFYILIARFVSNFCDGHTSVYTPNEEYSKYRDSGGMLFPIDVDCSSGEIRIVSSFNDKSQFIQGQTITAVNGVASNDILEAMVSLLSFKRREMSLTCISSVFGKLLFLLYGLANTFTIVLKSEHNDEEVVVAGVSYDVICDSSKKDPKVKEAPYTFLINKEGNYALLNFREFVDLNRFKKFIKEIFEEIKANDVNKLIVDLRKNGGGNSSLTDEFLSYIADKPFSHFSGMDFKVSKQIRQYYLAIIKQFTSFPMSLLPSKLLYKTPWKKEIGEIVSDEVKKRKHKPKQPFFTGRVIVLTSAYTFSSATDFAAAVQDNDLGVIVGSPTGGFPSTHGDSFPFTLPNTCLQCGVSHKFFVRANGNRSPEPLYPDFLVKESVLNDETDEVLEYAIQLEL